VRLFLERPTKIVGFDSVGSTTRISVGLALIKLKSGTISKERQRQRRDWNRVFTLSEGIQTPKSRGTAQEFSLECITGE
jgi:hypothetical protein